MATVDQIKGLIRAHMEQDDDKFKTVALQIAAYEAKIGHTSVAREIKAQVDKDRHSAKVLQFVNQNQLFLMNSPNEKLSDLVAPEDLHARIQRVLDEFVHRNKLQRYGLANRRKLLLEGKPGTGKTFSASIIASELHLPLFSVQADRLVTKFMGETSAKLRQVFDSIENISGVYLFDEFDAIGADRGMDNEVGEMRRVLNSFLQFIEMDQSESIIIAATNNRQILDKALFRRFDDVLHYALPAETEIFQLYSRKLGAFDTTFIPSDELIRRSVSLSHAEISKICDDAMKWSVMWNAKITNEYMTELVEERLPGCYREA